MLRQIKTLVLEFAFDYESKLGFTKAMCIWPAFSDVRMTEIVRNVHDNQVLAQVF